MSTAFTGIAVYLAGFVLTAYVVNRFHIWRDSPFGVLGAEEKRQLATILWPLVVPFSLAVLFPIYIIREVGRALYNGTQRLAKVGKK